jgi:hypothetical protein
MNFKNQILIINFLSRKIRSVLKDGALLGRDENIHSGTKQGQKLDPRCEINKHIFVFTYQLYIFILVVYNDVRQFSNNRAFVAK